MSKPSAIDTHAHVIDPERFAYTPAAKYLPHGQEIGTLERYLAVLDAHGISHAVLVQPTSGYLHDHRCMLDAVSRSSERLRAIVRLDPNRPREQADLLDDPSVAGARLDLVADGVEQAGNAETRWLLDALSERNKVLQVQCEHDQLAAVLPLLQDVKGTIVVDHCGRPDPAHGVDQPGFEALLELGRAGHYVKLAGAFRFSREPYPFHDCDPYVAALLDTFTPQRCVWGSDWPYLRIAGRIDYGPVLGVLQRWIPDAAARKQVLCDTAARLFGFE